MALTPPAYHLAKDAYVCLANDLLVFSDLQDDKYSCLDRANTCAALQAFPDFRVPGNSRCTDHCMADGEKTELVLLALCQAGLLVDSDAPGKPFAPIRIPTPMTSMDSSRPSSSPRARIGHCTSFLRAAIKASWVLRLQPIRRTVHRVGSRSRQFGCSGTHDEDALRILTSIFHRLRPYYPRGYLCRYDSLALIEFLAHYGLHPTWVFGVKSQPFGAHCWVQSGSCVLNDSIDYVRRFTPIMAF